MLNHYLEQLGLTPPASPSLSFLTVLLQRHIATHTFNNLGVLLHEPMSLEICDIYQKLVVRRAGGFCFEHNKLIMHILNALGYQTRLVMARVLNNNVRDVPRTHRFTVVTLDDGEYLVDGGFGISVPQAPIRLNLSTSQQVGAKTYQITASERGEFDLVEIRQGKPFILYRFDGACYSDADCAAGHLYSIAHPDAVFVNNLVVSINSNEQSHGLVNSLLTTTGAGRSESVSVTSPDQLQQILHQVFGLSTDRELCRLLFDRHILPGLKQSGAPL